MRWYPGPQGRAPRRSGKWPWWGELLGLLLVAAGPAMGCAWVLPRWERPVPVGPGEVALAQAEAWGSRVLWLDARAARDYQEAHLPQALSLNEDQWNERLAAVVEAWRPETVVVVYCDQRRCGAGHDVARRLTRELQWEQVYVLAGGWQQWQRAHP